MLVDGGIALLRGWMDGCLIRTQIDVIRGGFNGEQTEFAYLTDSRSSQAASHTFFLKK